MLKYHHLPDVVVYTDINPNDALRLIDLLDLSERFFPHL